MTELFQAYGGQDDTRNYFDNFDNDSHMQKQDDDVYTSKTKSSDLTYNANDIYQEANKSPPIPPPVKTKQAEHFEDYVPVKQQVYIPPPMPPMSPSMSQPMQSMPPPMPSFMSQMMQQPISQPTYKPKIDVVDTSYSFWDRLIIKRPEVFKLGVFALIFLLALATERFITHYLNKYLSDNVFTNFQEIMIRLSYPVGIFILIWIIKAL